MRIARPCLQRLVLLLHALQLLQLRAHAVQRGLQLREALLAPLAVPLLRLRSTVVLVIR